MKENYSRFRAKLAVSNGPRMTRIRIDQHGSVTESADYRSIGNCTGTFMSIE